MARVRLKAAIVEPQVLGEHIAAACAAGERDGLEPAVIRLVLQGTPDPAVVGEVLVRSLRGSDAAALVGGGCEVLVPDAGQDEVSGIQERLRRRLLDLGIASTGAAARFGRDGRTAETLRAAAERRCREEEAQPRARSAQAERLNQLVRRVADSNLSVLLLGETGVGKERIAEEIHQLSRRSSRPLVRLNCAAIAETLLESELFGYERGAFTGAAQAKPGLLETADGGTVFLDEIGDLPMPTQVKLLRVLEQREVQRIGALKPRRIDVRFVSATNKDLEGLVAQGAYREDLFYRLNGVAVHIPPLRQRLDELESLVRRLMIDGYRALGRTGAIAVTPEALTVMQAYRWPGNIRELRNVVERALVLCSGGAISVLHLPLEKLQTRPPPPAAPAEGNGDAAGPPDEESARRARVQRALDEHGGNQTEAARVLGVSRRTLFNWMEQLSIPGPRRRR